MGFWVEIHCDFRHLHCDSDRGDQPALLMNSDRQSQQVGIRMLENQAIKKGWKRLKTGSWVCPSCQKEEVV